MKLVRGYIDERRAAFATSRLFGYLRDTTVEPRRRLTFIPFLSHFVMTFADLYNLLLPEDLPGDRYQELVNAHVREDATHWRWFLADLTNAGLDPKLPFTQALRFIWSSETTKTRMLSYQICKIIAGMNSLQTLVVVHCIEAAGGVALEAAATAGRALEPQLGRKLVYFGSHHVDTESQHTLEDPAVRSALDEDVVADQEREGLRVTIDRVFGFFQDFVDEVYDLARSGRGFGDEGH